MFSRENLEELAERMRYATERIRHTNLTARLPKEVRMPANITLKEMCVL